VRTLLAGSLAFVISGCAAEPFEVNEGFFGGVGADAPLAALAARDVLVSGGTAVDAVVSAYFVSAVTLPSSFGLSAGGSCVVFDPAEKKFERLSFHPSPSSDGGAAIALPLAPRAMFALHARYGRTRIAQLTTEAEKLARFGFRVSRQVSEDIQTYGDRLDWGDRGTNPFGDRSRAKLRQGETATRLELAVTLGRMRAAGIGDLYEGRLARSFVDGATAAGYRVDADRLRRILPVWSTVEGTEYDNHVWAVAGTHSGEEATAKAMLKAAFFSRSRLSGADSEDAHLLAEAGRKSSAATTNVGVLGDGRGPSVGAGGIFAVDRRGQAASCSFTLGAPFGVGRVAGETGITMAPVDVAPERSATAFGLLVGNRNVWQVHLAMTASGGRGSSSALAEVVMKHYLDGKPMDEAIAAPRAHFAAKAGLMLIEPGMGEKARSGIARLGYRTAEVAKIGAVRMMRCFGGLPKGEGVCGIGNDRRASGLVIFEGEN
jgi:gamma-glutamyltranspeptidase / glutathione hydrolase